MTRRPRILVTLDLGESLRKGVPFANVNLKLAYVRAVEKAGGTPLLVAPTDERAVIDGLIGLMDGLVITGGAFDIDPARYGQSVRGRIDQPLPLRTDFEWALTEAAMADGKPVLGICGGMQLLNVITGGTLIQDVGAEVPGALPHEQASSPALPDHPVQLSPGCPLAQWVGATELSVNTTHHQAVDRLGQGFEVWGRAPDGVVEAIGHRDHPLWVGVQWHPELLADRASDALYGHLVTSASRVISAR